MTLKQAQITKSFIGKLSSLCFERYKSGKYPVALVSMDNCSHNGSILHEAVSTLLSGLKRFCRQWLCRLH